MLWTNSLDTVSGNRVHTEARRRYSSYFHLRYPRWNTISFIILFVGNALSRFPPPCFLISTSQPHYTEITRNNENRFFPPLVRASFFTSSRLESSDVMICRAIKAAHFRNARQMSNTQHMRLIPRALLIVGDRKNSIS